jgi:hypothetical protein
MTEDDLKTRFGDGALIEKHTGETHRDNEPKDTLRTMQTQ